MAKPRWNLKAERNEAIYKARKIKGETTDWLAYLHGISETRVREIIWQYEERMLKKV